MNPKLGFPNLVRQLLPNHKRQPVRLWLLRALAAPLGQLYGQFDAWRDNVRMMVNVNAQVRVLEGYLRKKYNRPVSIRIETFDDGLLLVCLEEEGEALMPAVGDEPGAWCAVPLEGEVRARFGDTDFIVYIPASLDRGLIAAEIERYKQALTSYKIVQN